MSRVQERAPTFAGAQRERPLSLFGGWDESSRRPESARFPPRQRARSFLNHEVVRDRSKPVLDLVVDVEGGQHQLDRSSCTRSAIFVVAPEPRSYGALPMARRTTHRFPSRCSSILRSISVLAVAAIASAVVLGSCTIANEAPGSGGIRIPAQAVSNARPPASPVVSAWLAAEVAFEEAALTADPDQPDLAATTVAPQLPWSQSLLAQMQSSGEVSRGPVDHGHPRIVAQRARTGHRPIVHA